ncbi:hypothetical protein ACF3NF_07410 [Anaerococcus martiniensis]|uniref:hypothetical protein n=1 Tax=Anaerococcus sp. WGS1579 TaxID=3366809 RepID=UPI00372D5CB3
MSDKRLEDDRLRQEDENVKESERLGRVITDLQHGTGINEESDFHNDLEDQIRQDIGMQGNDFSNDYNAEGNLENELKEDVGLLDDQIDKDISER